MSVLRNFSVVFIAAFALVALHCSKNSSSPTQPPSSTPPPSLNAAPSSVALGAGGSQDVTVSGGKPPYAIASPPNANATAQLQNADSASAIVHITGVSIASVSTSVVIRDNTASSPKSVSIPITVH